MKIQTEKELSSVDYIAIDANDILDIHKCLMTKVWYETVLGIIKKKIIVLLTSQLMFLTIQNVYP